jgi:hypothetical protein
MYVSIVWYSNVFSHNVHNIWDIHIQYQTNVVVYVMINILFSGHAGHMSIRYRQYNG